MTRTLAVILDSCDPEIALDLAAEGRMPVMAELLDTGGHATLVPPPGLFVGVIFATLTRAVDPASSGHHSWIAVDPATYERVAPGPRRKGTPIWAAAAEAGLPAVVIDIIHEAPYEHPLVTHVCEWGTEEPRIGFATWPPELAADIRARFGIHPLCGHRFANEMMLLASSDYLWRAGRMRTVEEDRAVAALLRPSIEAKTTMVRWLLAERPWTLGVVLFAEAHAAGHQLWHVHDPEHPRHDAALRREIGSPIESVYEAEDRALGLLLADLHPSTNVVVMLSHGMGPNYQATHMMEAILGRLHRWLEDPPSGLRRALRGTLAALPSPLGRAVAPLATAALRRRGWRPEDTEVEPLLTADERRRRAFYMAWNNDVVGGVRLNLVGREADGVVTPEGADRVLRWLEQQFRALVDTGTGRPLVARTWRCADLYPSGDDMGLPDLFVEWHRDHRIDRVWSPTIGVLHVEHVDWRSGTHREPGLVVARGPGITPGAHPDLPTGAVPSGLARLLGIPLPGAVHPPPTWWRPA